MARGVIRRFGGLQLKERSYNRRWDPPWPQRNPDRVPDSIYPKRRRNFVRKRPARNREGWIFNTFPQSNYQNVIETDQPIGMWPMRYGQVATGTAENDYSGCQHPLTWTITNPTALYMIDNAGIALAGDREATRVTGELWESPRSFTCEWWMQSNTPSAGFYAIFDRRGTNDRWAVYVDGTNGRLQLTVMQQGGVTPTTVVTTGVNVLDGATHHCVVEAFQVGNTSQSNYQFYVDTIDRGNGGLFATTIETGAETFRLCGENGTRFYNGNIAYCSFYNYPLSQSRVIAHYLAGVGQFTGELQTLRTRSRRGFTRRSRPMALPLPQATPPVAPPYPYTIIRALKRRAYRVPRGRFIVFVPPQVAPPGQPTVIEPIAGVLVTDGRTSGMLVTDGRTTGVLVTDGRTTTVIIT